MLQLHGGLGLGLGLGLVLGFYSVRHLMNGWDLKYSFSVSDKGYFCLPEVKEIIDMFRIGQVKRSLGQ